MLENKLQILKLLSLRKIIIIASILLIFILALSLVFLMQEDMTDLPAYSLGKITRGSIKSEVSATGTLSPVITVQVGSQVSGTIRNIYVDFNSEVKKGQVIAKIDAAIFKARLAEAEATLRSSQAARDKAWVAVQETKSRLVRVTDLTKQKLASESDLDAVRFAYQAAIVEHRFKEATVEQAKAALQRESVNLEYSTIYAPIDGVVISRNVDVGQTVAASLQAPTLFTIAQNLAQMQIETEVDEAYIGLIQQQQPVTFTVFAYQNQKFHGRVSQIRLQPKVEAGVVKYNCIIHVDNIDMKLKPGMTATVAIEVTTKNNVLKVANSALRYVPALSSEKLNSIRAKLKRDEAILWIPNSSQLSPVIVKVGIIGERETEVESDSIKEGVAIVLPPKRADAEQRRRFGLSLF